MAELAAAKRLSPSERSALMAALAGGPGGSGCVCGVCGDIAEAPAAALCGHVFCTQCLAGVMEGAGGRRSERGCADQDESGAVDAAQGVPEG